MMEEKERLIVALYKGEVLHNKVYQKFAESEKNKKMSGVLIRLALMEHRHAELWGKVLDINKIERPQSDQKFDISMVMFYKAIFGIPVTIKIIEHIEGGLHERFNRMLGSLSKKERKVVDEIRKDEDFEETPLEDQLVAQSRIFGNVRDIMFGMNDGLVELLAVAVGLAAALKTPLLIFLAGFIVAISGTLSMAAGAYLSTGYQKDVEEKSMAVKGTPTAKASAFYVGLFYFIGSLFPLSPFGFGVVGYTGIIIALVLTSIVLTFTSSMIALATDKSVLKSVAKTLLISLSVAVVTIILGAYIRSTLHISV